MSVRNKDTHLARFSPKGVLPVPGLSSLACRRRRRRQAPMPGWFWGRKCDVSPLCSLLHRFPHFYPLSGLQSQSSAPLRSLPFSGTLSLLSLPGSKQLTSFREVGSWIGTSFSSCYRQPPSALLVTGPRPPLPGPASLPHGDPVPGGCHGLKPV